MMHSLWIPMQRYMRFCLTTFHPRHSHTVLDLMFSLNVKILQIFVQSKNFSWNTFTDHYRQWFSVSNNDADFLSFISYSCDSFIANVDTFSRKTLCFDGMNRRFKLSLKNGGSKHDYAVGYELWYRNMLLALSVDAIKWNCHHAELIYENYTQQNEVIHFKINEFSHYRYINAIRLLFNSDISFGERETNFKCCQIKVEWIQFVQSIELCI